MQNESESWKRISERLFRQALEEPSPAFVQKVMRRIESAETRPRLVRITAPWFAPALGLAAMLMLAILPAKEGLSAETVILEGQSESGVFDEIPF